MKMNKKLIAVAAAAAVVIIAVCLISFSGKDDTQTTAPADGQPITVNLEPETTKEPFFKPSFNKTVTVTLPIKIVDEKYGDDLESFAEDKGYYSIKKVGDTHVKIKMREYSYRLLLTSVGVEAVSTIGYTMDSGNYPFVKDFAKYNSDFSDVVFAVDKKKYEKAENKDEFFDSIAYCCLYYQEYVQDSKDKCKITICEEGTNILLETREISRSELE